MKPASLLAEAVERSEPIQATRERHAVMEHVERHYRAIALPALAAAMRRRNGAANPPAPPLPRMN